VGRFTTSEYSIFATVGFANSNKAMRTQFFFESIPSDFIDINPDEWDFDPNHPEIPIIMSRDYLSLYNFGFAAAQGMPQISEAWRAWFRCPFTLTGNGHSEVIPGRIVGFSNRLNTIVVPRSS
jgi:hypothetical protein